MKVHLNWNDSGLVSVCRDQFVPLCRGSKQTSWQTFMKRDRGGCEHLGKGKSTRQQRYLPESEHRHEDGTQTRRPAENTHRGNDLPVWLTIWRSEQPFERQYADTSIIVIYLEQNIIFCRISNVVSMLQQFSRIVIDVIFRLLILLNSHTCGIYPILLFMNYLVSERFGEFGFSSSFFIFCTGRCTGCLSIFKK